MAEIKDLKDMTVRALRELAEKVVGPGYERFKTRTELIAAILATGWKGEGVEADGGAPRGAGDEHAWEKGPGSPGKAAEPRPEGRMVARVVGEDAVHKAPHALTEEHLAPRVEEKPAVPEPYDEQLGDLPWSYGDDSLIALPRDPHTLWIYWDYNHETIRRAMEGVDHPHAKLRIFDQGRLVREVDFALESGSYYVLDLQPGGHYRAEIFFVGTNGAQHRLGKPSNTIGLPPKGPAQWVDDRFVTLPWGIPLARRHDLFARAEPEGALDDQSRRALWEAAAGRPLGASENLPPGAPGGVRGGGERSGLPTSSSRYEGA